jgi:hypothetical protein
MIYDKDKVADELIDWHFRTDPGTITVYRIMSADEEAIGEPIKLLEVSEDTFGTGRVDAFGFGPAEDVPYSMVIAIVSKQEIIQIENGDIKLPDGWSLKASRKYERPIECNAVK